MFRIALDREAAVPLYEQVAESLRRLMRRGSLAGGERLPSARDLAAAAGVNRLTVEAAFARLEREGLLERRQGSGTYVLGGSSLLRAFRAQRAVAGAGRAGAFAGEAPGEPVE